MAVQYFLNIMLEPTVLNCLLHKWDIWPDMTCSWKWTCYCCLDVAAHL